MNLLSSNKLDATPSYETDPQKIAFRTRDLFAELLKRTIDMPTINGKPVFVDLHHTNLVQTQTSTSPAEALKNYEYFENLVGEVATRRTIQIDTPIPRRPELQTSASRLRVTLHATSANRDLYGYDLTAYHPSADCDADFNPTTHRPPNELDFYQDDIRHHLLIRSDVNNPGTYTIRTAIQTVSDVRLGTTSYAYLDQNNLAATDTLRVLPELTRQEERTLSTLGARALAYTQLREDLSIISALVGEDPTHPMGAY